MFSQRALLTPFGRVNPLGSRRFCFNKMASVYSWKEYFLKQASEYPNDMHKKSFVVNMVEKVNQLELTKVK